MMSIGLGMLGIARLPPAGTYAVGTAGPSRRRKCGLCTGPDPPATPMPNHSLTVTDAGADSGPVVRVELTEHACDDEVSVVERPLDLGMGEGPRRGELRRPVRCTCSREDGGCAHLRG